MVRGLELFKLPKPLYILFVAGSAVAAFGILQADR